MSKSDFELLDNKHMFCGYCSYHWPNDTPTNACPRCDHATPFEFYLLAKPFRLEQHFLDFQLFKVKDTPLWGTFNEDPFLVEGEYMNIDFLRLAHFVVRLDGMVLGEE